MVVAVLRFKDANGKWMILEGVEGPKGDTGKTGNSGVYLGEEIPTDEDVKVWINPNGEAENCVKSVNDIVPDESGNVSMLLQNGWKVLQAITIPAQASGGTGNVAYANVGNGIIFAFDKDAQGNEFSCNEFFIMAKAATALTGDTQWTAPIAIANSNIPQYDTNGYITSMYTGYNSEIYHTAGLIGILSDTSAYSLAIHPGDWSKTKMGWHGTDPVYQDHSTAWNSLAVFIGQQPNYGFLESSKIYIYGR